jgi:formate dehydrogenase major subunit
MSEIILTINGKQVKGQQGNTILDVCLANSIDLPTLCHYQGLSDVGACRLCLVEIEKERNPLPACTYPAREGLVIQTATENLQKYRRLILELLFTERNHLCAYCVASGDCELQNLAYKYQMDNARFEYAWPNQIVDSSHVSIVLDHNRCILCGRCIRTCDEITGAHTLDFGKRGWKTLVCADINQPLGESSCISCGGCFQSCPTGAIFSKESAYRSRPEECVEIASTCAVCGVGCDIKGMVKDNKLVRIDSPDMTKPRGLLCEMGRFGPLYIGSKRVTSPMKKNSSGQLETCSYEEAFSSIAKKLGSTKNIVGLASGKANSETLQAFIKLMNETIETKLIDTLDGDDFRTISSGITKFDSKAGISIEAKLEDILTADTILLIGAHPIKTHPVVGSYIMRSVAKNKAQLVILDPLRNPFTFRASVWLKPAEGKEGLTIKILGQAIAERGLSGNPGKFSKEYKDMDVKKTAKELNLDIQDINEASKILAESKSSIIIYGGGILQYKDPDLIAAILTLSASISDNNKPRVISLKRYANSCGSWEIGLANAKEAVILELSRNKIDVLYVLLGEDQDIPETLTDCLKRVQFTIVQSGYLSSLTDKADVVIPSLLWTESKGSYTTIDGMRKSTMQMLKTHHNIKTDADSLREVARHLKK